MGKKSKKKKMEKMDKNSVEQKNTQKNEKKNLKAEKDNKKNSKKSAKVVEKNKKSEKEIKISEKNSDSSKLIPIIEQEEVEKRVKRRRKIKKSASILFIAIMLALLVVVGFFLFQRAFRATDIAKFLDPNTTVALVQINSDLNHQQYEKGFRLLEKHSGYSKADLIAKLETILDIQYNDELEAWLGRKVGIAAINNEDHIELVYFIEVNDKTKAKAAMKDMVLYDDKNFGFIGSYLFFSANEKIVKNITDFAIAGKQTLFETEKYRKINENLPENNLAFVYIDLEKITNDNLQSLPELKGKSIPFNYLNQFLTLFDSEGMALIALNDKFALQTFTSIKKENLAGKRYITYEEKYNLELANYVDKDVLVFWGGQSLENQIGRAITVLSGSKVGSVSAMNVLFDSYIKKYFGKDMTFKDDILSLIDGEFAITIEGDEKKIYKMLFKLNNVTQDSKKIKLLAENFAKYGAMFKPEIIEHELEDGTISREIVSIAVEMSVKNEIYNGVAITSVIWGDTISSDIDGVSYAIIDDVAIVSSDLDSLKESIDLAANNTMILRNSDQFNVMIDSLSVMSDEVAYFNIEKLLPVILEDESFKILEIISSISSGKIYFKDGISSINYLQIKNEE